jgi:hypothetical protein
VAGGYGGAGRHLAFTGADLQLILGIALAALILGAVLFFLARRKRGDDDNREGSRLRTGVLSAGVLLSLGLVFTGGHAAEAAQAPVDGVDIITACEFLELSGVTVETDAGDGALPGTTYDVLTATITNDATFPAEIYLNTNVSSDPSGLAQYTTLTAFEDNDRIYAKNLNDQSADAPTRLEPGESITVRFRATLSPEATNAQQAARVIYDVIVTAIQAA